MPTPLALTLPPLLWAALAAAGLCVLGSVVGRTTGRLVHLFGPTYPSRTPEHSAEAEASPTVPRTGRNPVLLDQDSATGALVGQEGAPDTPLGTPSGPPPAGPVLEPEEDDDGPPPPCCPHCRAELPFVRGLPVVASRTFRRRGTCPHCERRVRPCSAVIIGTALLFALVGALVPWYPGEWTLFGVLALLWLIALGVPLSVIDLRVMRLPDALVAPAYPVAALLMALAVLLPPVGPDLERGSQALVGMALITALYWLMWRIRPGGLGFGDVKLSGLTGLYAGWAAGPVGALVAAFWAFAAFSLVGLVLLALRRITRAQPFPLGPFMLAATLATVLAGQPLLP